MLQINLSKSMLWNNIRKMSTLKDVRLRIKSITNIQKLTKSMKMVAAARYNKADRDFSKIRPYGPSLKELIKKIPHDSEVKSRIIIGVSSDRGLCGSVHTSIVKAIHQSIINEPGIKTGLILLGDKICPPLLRLHASNVLFSVSNIGKTTIAFEHAALLAQEIMPYIKDADKVEIYHNHFKSVISFSTVNTIIPSIPSILREPSLNIYDDAEDELMKDFMDFSMACALYFSLRENNLTELSARMSSMDTANKNAGEMIQKLTLIFNRTRQSMITRELIEIISGATALAESEQ